MLGWALKKGFQGATGTRDAPTNVGGGGGEGIPECSFITVLLYYDCF